MNQKKEIIKIMNQISGRYSPYEVFTDWIKMGALAFSNSCQMRHDKVWNQRERAYLETVKKYERDEVRALIRCLDLLCETLEAQMTDVLGEIYMEAGMGSKASGQFFTPFHLSLLCAKTIKLEPDENGHYILNEPSCGGGGMIIAYARTLKEDGINYQRKLKVVAQDLDWKGVYMTYLQCSLLGINAICVQGDTLAEPYAKGYPRERVLWTPAKWGVLI